ncbi:polyprenol monophosphomannose synthase [Amycolatopsis nigrescens]|uniref:polyprenol monophosphomannose synthase n=1 Tax=Amycolatopsis nigrescens TaxID=381445 RepID=UPI000382A023|nr:polyprenol monophosphomannose synthase [Amycolatopsis nigrescens]
MTQEPVVLPAEWQDTPVTVVIPTYNEAGNLPKVIDALDRLPLAGLGVVVVDDGSPDGTGDLADELAERWNATRSRPMTVLHRTAKNGLGRAYVAGMTAALDGGARYVVQMDADLSHPPEKIPAMLGTALSNEAGVVIGSRYVNGGQLDADWPLNRRLLSKWATFYVNRILPLRLRDVTAGFKLWSAAALRDIRLDKVRSNGYSFQVECNHRAVQAGHVLLEVPIYFSERTDGASKMTLAVKIESALTPWRLRRKR